MNADRLLAHYEEIAEAPDAIERLRHFVLDLAVRGKLVTQDPQAEPASLLLRQIAAEQLRSVSDRKPRPQNQLPEVDLSQAPFELPRGWTWARFPELGIFGRGKSKHRPRNDPALFDGGEHLMIQTGDVARSRGEIQTYTNKYNDFGLAQSCKWPKGTLCITIAANIADSGILTFDACFPDSVVGFIPNRILKSARYFEYFVRTAKANLLQFAPATAQKNINLEILTQVLIPLPPLSEQGRIVERVDELIALCNELETARAAREGSRDRLAAASLARLNTPDPDTFQADARFALDALSALTTRADQIKQLRQTIFRLARRGKLVPQVPSEEPAAVVLARIRTRRAELLRSGYPSAEEARAQLRKQAEQSIPSDLPPLPLGWTWTTLQQCSLLVIDCKNKTAPYVESGIKLVRTTNVRNGQLNSIDQKFVDTGTYQIWSARCKPEPGDILITREAPMGEVCIIPNGEQICLGQRMMLARLVPETIDQAFMLYSLRDPDLMDRVQDKPIGATVQHLRVGGVETLLIPLPPVAEQRRIAAKIDELMALFDELEDSLSKADTTRQRLLNAVLAEALTPTAMEEAA